MDHNDRAAISGLFERLATVEAAAPARDAEAQAFIAERIARQPAAPYYMAQTVVVQQAALEQAEARIAELEAEVAEGSRSGGLLGGLFGGAAPRPRAAARRTAHGATGPAAMARHAPGQGGGFLAGAAQTAMGVAGGMLLANAVAGMFGADEAAAGETADAFGGGDDDGGDIEL